MNDSSILKTSAAALAFFLGPLAWADPWHESETAEEPASVSSAAGPEPSLAGPSLPS
ncbi:MAG: hypothetical protein FD189_1158 [Elusimicrobia bacterium]|nr:MAG: hypothetical protein FD154_865 [Elusimicrobiota bacterium]KAF0156114.1 MAG: hypothetical protein FD189_1158 [Elusimicrobiota bacterium]